MFIPASNQKLLTSAFALSRLTRKFAFTTSVYRLASDLVVVGDGDPTLGDPRLAVQAGKSVYAELDRWSAAARKTGGGRVTGDLLVCSLLRAKEFRHPDWPVNQHHRWYAAPVSGLNFQNNCFDVTFTVSGAKVTPHVSPVGRFIRVVSGVKVGRKHLWSLVSNADDSCVRLRGTLRSSTSEPLSVAANNPPMLLGRALAERLLVGGVKFTGGIRRVAPEQIDLSGGQVICETSTPLSVVLRRANKRSLNMAAECVFLRAAAHAHGAQGIQKHGQRLGAVQLGCGAAEQVR